MKKKTYGDAPKGFYFSTAEAAIKKPGRKDLALIYSEVEADMAGAFTTNRVKAAPVRIDMRKIKSGRGQAIIVNSGNANACSGAQGLRDANEMAGSCVQRSACQTFPCLCLLNRRHRFQDAYGENKTGDYGTCIRCGALFF